MKMKKKSLRDYITGTNSGSSVFNQVNTYPASKKPKKVNRIDIDNPAGKEVAKPQRNVSVKGTHNPNFVGGQLYRDGKPIQTEGGGKSGNLPDYPNFVGGEIVRKKKRKGY